MPKIRAPRSFNTVKNSNRNERLKKQQKQRLLILAMLATVALLVLTLAVFAVCAIVSSITGGNAPDAPSTPPAGSVIYQDTTEITSKIHTGPLIVVNKSYIYSFPTSPTQGFKNFKTEDRVTINGNNAYQINQSAVSLYSRPEAFDAFESMMRDYYMQTEDGAVKVREVYRSADAQENMNTSVKAGYSDHHTGYLFNISSFDNTSLPADHWIYQNCHKYGFIIRYPADKTTQTGVSNYTEAIRYVGVAHATYIKNNNLCLEEYVNRLKDHTLSNALNVSVDNGDRYQIYYVPASPSDALVQFKVPSNYSYEVSGDNVGGLIVTVNLNSPTE